jgi:hypothetical protein
MAEDPYPFPKRREEKISFQGQKLSVPNEMTLLYLSPKKKVFSFPICSGHDNDHFHTFDASLMTAILVPNNFFKIYIYCMLIIPTDLDLAFGPLHSYGLQ